jgi:concanavalin A-like lectin/glucanase superfamily protein/Big-like domain-containing protein
VGVQFRLQGAPLGSEDTTNPYSTSWNTTIVANGSYTLTAIARDAAGNTTTSVPLTVTVSNTSPPPGGGAPVTAWTAVAQHPSGSWNNSSWDNRSFRILLAGSAITTNGATVQLTLQGRTSGNYTVQRVSLVRRDGTTLNGVDSTHRQLTFGGTWNAGVTVPAGGTITSDPIPFDLLTGQDVFVTYWVPAGNPTVYRNGGTNAVAWTIPGTDQSAAIDWGNLSTSATSQNIYVAGSLDVLPSSGGDTTAPTITLTAPSAGTVSGTVTVSASASDTVGVVGVQFRLQGANLGAEDTTNPYSTSWNTTTVPNGSYTLTAIARDAAGNTTTSAPRTVTVSNTSTPPPTVSIPPLAHWTFDEGAGVTAFDSSANGHNGTIDGAAWTTSGKLNGALNFDGSNDFVDVGTWDVLGSAITLAMWFKADDFGISDARLLTKSTNTAEQDHYFMLSTIQSGGMKLRFRLKTAGTTHTLVANSGTLSVGEWIHAAAVYDGSQMRLYKDGVEVGSRSKAGALSTNSTVKIRIAQNPNGYGSFDGLMDDVRVYNRALTPAEIQQLAAGVPD